MSGYRKALVDRCVSTDEFVSGDAYWITTTPTPLFSLCVKGHWEDSFCFFIDDSHACMK
jgi:hypothetical protein